MQARIFSWIFIGFSRFLGALPLRLVHALGQQLGLLFHRLKPKSARILRENLKQSGLYPSEAEFEVAVHDNMQEMGKTMLESLAIWGSSQARVLSNLKRVHHGELIDQALATKRGIIFLTPHIGCFEISSIYYAKQHPMTILYRPARKAWMDKCITDGRSKGYIKLAPTNMQGVKRLFAALKHGEAIGILPDQIASKGDGEWADFFGKPVYTMTLVSKMAQKTGAVVIMAAAERLPNGQGFELHLRQLTSEQVATPAMLNQQVEQQVREIPLQYMWNYDRYKQP